MEQHNGTLTEPDYLTKRASYANSHAPLEVIKEAIAKLDKQWLELNASKRAYKDYEEGKADISDIN